MTLLEQIMQSWLQEDVKIQFTGDEPPYIGKLSERCKTGVFVIIEGEEYFMPFANIVWIKRMTEVPNVAF